MKQLLTYLFVGLLFLFIGVLLTNQCQDPEIIDNSQEIQALVAEVELKDKQLDSLNSELDSIKSQRQEVVTHTTQQVASIDSSIAKDSTNSIPEFRSALTLWGDLPDNTDFPTYRELGLSAKNMTKGYGFKLELKSCDNEVANLLSRLRF
jgi:hypothetical protein